MRSPVRPRATACAACLGLWLAAASATPAAAGLALPEAWPEPGAAQGEAVRFPSRSPFTPAQAADAPPATAVGRLFVPEGASAAEPVPAVVLLHGSGGIVPARETAYARQLARLGVAALVLDSFAARAEPGAGYVDRLVAVTETMLAADAYAALAWLAAGRPEVDAARVAVAGFSYGGLAALYAANAGVADRLAQGPRRFAGHAAYYPPCVGGFEDPRTTGAPLLMLAGALDETSDADRCRALAEEFRRGGSEVRLVVYGDAAHQWDGAPGTDWRARYGISGCRFEVGADGTVRDLRTGLAIAGETRRYLSLALCADRGGYRLKEDAAVRTRSTAELARFLNAALGGGAAAAEAGG